MAVTLKEFVQTQFTNDGVTFYTQNGDYYEATYLIATHSGTLQLAPAWSNEALTPGNWIPQGIGCFLDGTYVLIGVGGTYPNINNLLHTTDLATFTQVNGIASGYPTYKPDRCIAHAGKIYLVTVTGVWSGTPTTTPFTQINTATNIQHIFVAQNQVFITLSTGAILKLNASADAFETCFTPPIPSPRTLLEHSGATSSTLPAATTAHWNYTACSTTPTPSSKPTLAQASSPTGATCSPWPTKNSTSHPDSCPPTKTNLSCTNLTAAKPSPSPNSRYQPGHGKPTLFLALRPGAGVCYYTTCAPGATKHPLKNTSTSCTMPSPHS